MIDDEFSPSRSQLRALGFLLRRSQLYPLSPGINEIEFYREVYQDRQAPIGRQDWLVELAAFGLVRLVGHNPDTGHQMEDSEYNICLTPEGIFYVISHSELIAANARTPTDDFPDEIVDAPWAALSFYAPSGGISIEDEKIEFDRNEDAYRRAVEAIDKVYESLSSDNEIGDLEPNVRDDKLAELRLIRAALVEKSGWRSKLIAMSWGALGYIATHFADRPVGQLADEAWAAIQAII